MEVFTGGSDSREDRAANSQALARGKIKETCMFEQKHMNPLKEFLSVCLPLGLPFCQQNQILYDQNSTVDAFIVLTVVLLVRDGS